MFGIVSSFTMTSSFRIKKRFEEFNKSDGEVYSFGNYADHYIAPWGNCHPNYTEHVIGNNQGVKVCVKRVGETPPINSDPPKNGLTRFSPNLYSPLELPGTDNNTYRYQARVAPNREVLVNTDHLRLPVKYNGIGQKPINTPRLPRNDMGPGEGQVFYEYYLQESLVPPPKYDLSRSVQTYPLWQKAMLARGYSQKEVDAMSLKTRNQYMTPI